MSKGALRVSALIACTAGFVLASHNAHAVGPVTTPTPHPTSTGSSGGAAPSGGPRHFLTAQSVPDYEWKFDNNFKDSGKFHPRGDLGPFQVDTPIHGFGLGSDGAANGATTDLGRFKNPQGTFRKEAFTFTFNIFPDYCSGSIFLDGVGATYPHNSLIYNSGENSITLGSCKTTTDIKGVTTVLGGTLQASFTNKKPDKTLGKATISNANLKLKAWNEVQIVYDGPNKLITMYVNGTKTEAPTVGLITVPGEGRSDNFPNDVLIGGPKEATSGFTSDGNVDNFRWYADALYPVSTANVGAHAGAGPNTSIR